jgi:hypothetical protein
MMRLQAATEKAQDMLYKGEVLLSPTYFRTVGECLSEALDRVERCLRFAQIDPTALGNALDTLART